MEKLLRIGTRGSPLALKQTEMVREALAKLRPELEIETVVIKTSGDWNPAQGETRLSTENGGKGQFAKEIQQALLAGEIDAAVHSMKDMESQLPDGLAIDFMLPREDARDALLVSDKLKDIKNVNDLPEGAVIGTASVRRQAFLLQKRPDLQIVPFRGNVGTRLEKLKAGQVDATLLAMAGLKRLGFAHPANLILEPQDMLPAAGQGAVGIEIKQSNQNKLAFFSQISCAQTLRRVKAERAALAVLDGSCHTPIGAYAVLSGKDMHLRVCVAALDGSEFYGEEACAAVQNAVEAENMGRQLGEKLKSRVPPEILEQSAA